MRKESDLIGLYSQKILALASDIPHLKPISSSMITTKARSPICGSYLTVGLKFDAGVVVDFAQDVKACALGQASAALFGRVIIGLSQADITRGQAELLAMLQADGPIPTAPFEGYEVLLAAREFSNRHASIMLPFTASLQAFNLVESDPSRSHAP